MSVNYKAIRVRMTESAAEGCTADLYSQTPPLVGFHVIGDCPRCGDRTHDLFPLEYLGGQEAGAPSGAAPAVIATLRWTGPTARKAPPPPAGATRHTDVALQRCRCIENHAGADGKYGCGATWLIAATYDLANIEQRVTFAAVAKDEAYKDWEGAASRAQSAADALTTVQAAAAKWQTALTAILGLVAVLTVIGGRSTLQGLATPYQYLAGVAAALAIAANARAIYQANLAAVGFPKLENMKELPPLIDSDEAPTAQARVAVERLQSALHAATASLIMGMVAVALVWYGTGAPSTSATLVLTNGQSICGSIATSDLTKAPDQILFTSNGVTKPYQVSDIQQITVGSC
jgi:hypothetical protein